MKHKTYNFLLIVFLLLITSFFYLGEKAFAAVTISVTPHTDSVLPGSVRSVYSNVQGDSNIAVTWTTTGGSLENHIGYTIWTAPLAPGTYTVSAISVADNTKIASASFTVISDAVVNISNIPMQATIYKNQPLVIQSIFWGSVNTNVTWSASGGTLSGTGRETVFLANQSGTYTITAASQADNTKIATTTVVVTNNAWPNAATANKTIPIDCTATGSGTTYEVTSESEMDVVPWRTLGPGDTVRIHPGTYHRQILVATSGSDSQPIRICGVRDSNGNLPELNGANAIAKAGSQYGSGAGDLQSYGGIIVYNYGGAYYGGAIYPKNIIIEGLKIDGFNASNTFTDLNTGQITNYDSAAAPIRIQRGGNITIRGNDLEDNGNGLFTMANNGVESQITRNLLVEGNYISNNGVNGDYLEHQSYLQAFGLVVQGNYYDKPRTGMPGGQLKTRAVQQFIRYNYFEPALRILDLVEVQDDGPLVFPWVGVEANEMVNSPFRTVVANYEAYQNKFVYGNILHNIGTSTAAYMVHGAADNDEEGNSGGTLYLYNNTFLISFINGQTSNWRGGVIDFGPYNGTANVWPTARLTNNVIHIAGPGSGQVFYWNRYGPDRVILDKNWISNIWGTGNLSGGDGTGIAAPGPGQGGISTVWQGGLYAGQVTGLANLATGANMPFDSNSYIPNQNGPLINSSAALVGEENKLPPLMQFSPTTHLMTARANFQDIGAINYSSNQTSQSYSVADFVLLVSNWFRIGTISDKNVDNMVNAKDLGIMMSNWN